MEFLDKKTMKRLKYSKEEVAAEMIAERFCLYPHKVLKWLEQKGYTGQNFNWKKIVEEISNDRMKFEIELVHLPL